MLVRLFFNLYVRIALPSPWFLASPVNLNKERQPEI
jgi:hypothetical protein